MGKKDLAKELEKCKHPNSRKTLNVIRKTKKVQNREKKKFNNAAKTNLNAKKLFWFYEEIETRTECLSPDEFETLIEKYLSRFDEELEQIKIKQSINKKRVNQHASRESVIKITLEKEKEDFQTGGLELPNLCDPEEFKHFKEWDGDAAKIQHIKLRFISKSLLEKLRKSETSKMRIKTT